MEQTSFVDAPLDFSYDCKILKILFGVVAACSAYNRKVVGSNPSSALLIPEVNVVDIQLRALLGLCSLLVHSAKYAGNRM